MCYFIYGILIIYLLIIHYDNSYNFCKSISQSTLYDKYNNYDGLQTLSSNQLNTIKSNPELFVWDNCDYKVYPFTNNDKYRCQCRVFVINWNEDLSSLYLNKSLTFNLTQNKMITGILTHWYMLEKFKSDGNEIATNTYNLNECMFKASKMKAFEWNNAEINFIDNNIGNWKDIEYLKFLDTHNVHTFPSNLGLLTKLKFLVFQSVGLTSFPIGICNLTEVRILHLLGEQVAKIPNCFLELKQLQQLRIDVQRSRFGEVDTLQIPMGAFNLPNLIDFSLWYSTLTFYTDIFIDDIDNNNYSHNIFNENFLWNNYTKYYLESNPICDNITILPLQLQIFINETKSCVPHCDVSLDSYLPLCPPIYHGDGKCDVYCQFPACNMDDGDCVQLCFNNSYSECTWDLFTNDKCDKECDNKYCVSYKWNTKWDTNTARSTTKNGYEWYTDFFQCRGTGSGNGSFTIEDRLKNYTFSETECHESTSIYTDPNDLAAKCDKGWIGDGFCDDLCRTDECLNDNNDCDLNCLNDYCSLIYNIWLAYFGNIYFLPHNEICSTTWGDLAQFSDEFESLECVDTLKKYDYNNDSYANMREAVGMFGAILYDIPDKSKYINCSSCIGVGNYNYYVSPQNISTHNNITNTTNEITTTVATDELTCND